MDRQTRQVVALLLAAIGAFVLLAPEEYKMKALPAQLLAMETMYQQVIGGAFVVAAWYVYNNNQLMMVQMAPRPAF